jgi:NTP pyrophosphatase (non-canonical NTP hydrolase)
MTGMTLDEYQRGALTTASYPASARIVYPALKLAGESGEVAEKVGKLMRDEGWTPSDELSDTQRDALAKELGDVLWYVAVLASDLGVSLESVAAANLAKLASRKARGVIGGSGDER